MKMDTIIVFGIDKRPRSVEIFARGGRERISILHRSDFLNDAQ